MDDCPWLIDRLAVVESDEEGTTVRYEDQEVGEAVQGDEESHRYGEHGAAPSPPLPPPPPAPPPTPFEFKAATGRETIVPRPPHGHRPSSSTAMPRCSGDLLPPPPSPAHAPVPSSPSGPSWEVRAKYNTRICRFHKRGRCNKGSACTFAHSVADLRMGQATMQAFDELLMPLRTELCHFWGKGKCKRGSLCTFLHCPRELSKAARHSEGSAGELSGEEQRRVKAAFDLFDEPGLGWLDYEDLKGVMRALGHEPGEWELFEVFGNRSVRVRYEEFLSL